MALSWNEIKSRAVKFSKEWENETSEDAEAKSFWDDFFNVFGISRRRVATFETRVTKGNRKNGFIDLLWKGQLLVEHKSAGKDLDRAYTQATDYFQGLKEHELPKYIVVCNFQEFRIYDLDDGTEHEFSLKELVNNVHHFGFIAGYQKRSYKEEDPVNIEAAMLMGKLHDRLKEVGYTGHQLEVYLVRLLFCMFADDTSIFERGIFQDYIELKTNEDGSDLAYHIAAIFNVLNIPREQRLKNIDEHLALFPYVNGKLFEEILPMASFDSEMRETMLNCCKLDWGKISPAIFGSLFQSVMNPEERRHLGAHYTSEKNILKLIKPLFLDELWEKFEKVKNNTKNLAKFHNDVARLRFIDPACGCGNFLVIAYRELRMLEIEIIKILQQGQQVTDISSLNKIEVDRFYGIEVEEFPAQIAQVAMWLMDHQMNMKVSDEFGEYFLRLPLKKSAKIVYGNALRIDWEEIIETMPWDNDRDSARFDYILGNPPFIGHHYQNEEQKKDLELVFEEKKGIKVLDYVSCWYLKAAKYCKIEDSNKTKVAFVSTNSIVQGEQVFLLWNILLFEYNIKIHFAHRTFKWNNESKGVAAVHVVIVGFADFDINNKLIFEYSNIQDSAQARKAKNINPYLVDGPNIILKNLSQPICPVPKMVWGNKPTDGGNFLFNDELEKKEFLEKEPDAKKWIRPYISGRNLINNTFRYCLWLKDISPSELKKLPKTKEKVEAVREFRLNSKAKITREKAKTPTLFAQTAQPNNNYLAVPEVSSENRIYIPIAYISSNVIASNKIQMIPNADLYVFSILTSMMHVCWVKYTCGRLKSDISYSNTIVYNNYPWPESPTEKQKQRVEKAAQGVLDVRTQFPSSSLADLYDPITMPPALVKAHNELDKAVDLCYRPQPFVSDTNRIEFLFELYDKYTSPLIAGNEKRKNKTVKK